MWRKAGDWEDLSCPGPTRMWRIGTFLDWDLNEARCRGLQDWKQEADEAEADDADAAKGADAEGACEEEWRYNKERMLSLRGWHFALRQEADEAEADVADAADDVRPDQDLWIMD